MYPSVRSLYGIAAGVGLAWACNGGGVFACVEASQCGSVDAICSEGYCAFPDAACDSGFSYGEHSPGSLAGGCVPVDDATSTGTSTNSSTSTTTSGPDPTSGDSTSTTTGPAVDDTAGSTTAATPWLAGDWPYRLPITIDGSQVAGALSDFGVLVSWTQNDALAADADGVAALSFAAFDEPLDYEIETYDPDTGAIVAWVRLSTLDAGVDTVFHLYYAGTSGGQQAGDPWAGYGGVWHLSADPGDTTPDATVHQNDGATIGPALLVEAGKIGDAVRFDGATDGITIAHDPSLRPGPALTLSAWVLADAFPVDAGVIVAKATTYGSGAQNTYYMRTWDAWLEVVVKVPDLAASSWNGYGQDDLGAWHHVAGVHEGGFLHLYFDGVLVASSDTDTSFAPDPHPLRIGSWGEGTEQGLATRTWDGLIDEVRVTTAARSDAWIATEFANQDAPETFALVGAPETEP